MSAAESAIGLNHDPYSCPPRKVPRHRETRQLVPDYGAIDTKLSNWLLASEEQKAQAATLPIGFNEGNAQPNAIWPPDALDKFEEKTWLPIVLRELEMIDDEIEEDNLPQISSAARKEARRILNNLRHQTITPTVYPTKDGEIAIHFKSPVAPEAVLIELNNNGQGACFSHTDGKSRRSRYEDSSELPDEFVKAQLEALKITASAK